MNRSLRFLMGVAIIAILTPALAAVMPDRITSWVWHSDSSTTSVAPAMASVDREIQAAAATSTNPPTTEMAASSLETAPTREVDAASETTTTSAVADEEPHESPDDESSTGNQDPTSTTRSTNPPKSTTSTSSNQTSKTITGQACPCEVTGTVELKGKVSLEGDLVVSGGTLVARPGVDVNGNGFQIMFMNGGKADFQGTEVFTWSNRGAKQNLERDIVFRNMQRIMWMNGGGKSILKYFTVANSGTPTIGDYPLHWHLNGNSTRGTIVEGVVVLNGKHHAYVPHGSHGITFKNVIAKNTTDRAFWWDPPKADCPEKRGRDCTFNNSNDTVFDRALVDGVVPSDRAGDGRHTMSAFHLGAGSGNVVRNSVALNVNGGKNCSGFQWPSSAARNEGGSVWTFQNNYSKSSGCQGIFVWQNDPGRRHLVDGFSGGGIVHGAYNNDYEYRNIDVSFVQVQAGGWSITGGRVGTLTLGTPGKTSPNDPTFAASNTMIDRLIVDNKAKKERERDPKYVFNSIGMSCGDIQYQSTEPGTSITIDGKNCPVP